MNSAVAFLNSPHRTKNWSVGPTALGAGTPAISPIFYCGSPPWDIPAGSGQVIWHVGTPRIVFCLVVSELGGAGQQFQLEGDTDAGFGSTTVFAIVDARNIGTYWSGAALALVGPPAGTLRGGDILSPFPYWRARFTPTVNQTAIRLSVTAGGV